MAGAINKLSASSKETAEQSDQNHQKIEGAINSLLSEAEHLVQIIEEVNGRTQNLAASTEQMSSATTIVLDAANSIKQSLDALSRELA